MQPARHRRARLLCLLRSEAAHADPYAAADKTTRYAVLTFQPQTVQGFRRLHEAEPDIAVGDGAPSSECNAKAALMRSGAPVDVLYVRDATLPSGSNSWLHPIDACPGVDA